MKTYRDSFPLDTIPILNFLSPSKTAVTCAISRPYFMGFTRSYYAKRAISKLFHKKTFYGSEPGVMARVECSRNAGIFVENKVSKLFFPLFLSFSSSPPAPPPPQLRDVYLCFYSHFPFPWLTLEWAKKSKKTADGINTE